MTIKRNVGLPDKFLRLGAGLVMVYFGFIDETAIPDQVAAMSLGIFGSIFLLTAIFSFCPLYNLIGISTCTDKNTNKD
jgi:Inner membrane protein YgaP-like, transmembrane domain